MTTPKKVFVLGSNGMAGKEFSCQLKNTDFDLITVARSKANIVMDCTQFETLIDILNIHEPDIIINCCAIIDLEFCELYPYDAYPINVNLVEKLSAWCHERNKKLVHISTDHYYNYGDDVAHSEDDPIITLNNYCRQKLSAEHFASFSKRSLILRTSITGIVDLLKPKTFFDWAYYSCINSMQSTLFTNAYTSTIDVTTFVNHAIEMIKLDASGIFNVASSEVYSKAEFVIELSRQLNLPSANFRYGELLQSNICRANCLGLSVKKHDNIISKSLPDLKQVVKNLIKEVLATDEV